jgi:glycosyltransferase involved in cell wall biosynthesis
MPELLEAGVEVICVEQWDIARDPWPARAALQGIWNFRAARMLEAELDALDRARTVVHLHGWTKSLSSSVVRTVIRRGFSIVCTLHDYFTACPNGGFFNFQTEAICHLQPLSVSCVLSNCDSRGYPQKAWRVVRQGVQRRFGLVPQGIRHFIVVSQFSQKVLEPFLSAESVCHLVPNLIDVEQEPRVDAGANTGYVMVGRLAKEKGVALFAKAASIAGYPATFVGDGECRGEIERLCPQAYVSGWVSRGKVGEHLRGSRALVFPSTCYETFGLSVLEAASLGIPAIVPDSSSARELIENGVTGLWFRSGSLQDLVEKMRMLQDGRMVTRFSNAAYERYWAKPLTMEHHVARLEAVYDQVLAG